VIAHLSADRLVLAGHSPGAAIAMSADPGRSDGLLLLDPAGLTRLHVGAAVLRATLPWLLRPTRRRSSALLRQMHAAGSRPPPELIDWMTLVARHCRTTVAPSPLPHAVLRRWREVPRAVLVGAEDCFLPAARLRSSVDTELRTEPRIVGEAGHLLPEERPTAVAAALAELPRPGKDR
jgi:pimeloyl-ACP methyl ester carboxylesterase